jgi:hypothetical protein
MSHRGTAVVLAWLVLIAPLRADEGMWTFDNPPLKRLQEAYGFTPTPAWLEKVRLASVRFNDGGSGSFVSADGLMITNHHVGLACIQNLSTPEKDYVAQGYLAPSRDKEPACPGYEVNVLMSMEDVTQKVLGAVKPEMSDKEAGEARKAANADAARGRGGACPASCHWRRRARTATWRVRSSAKASRRRLASKLRRSLG